MRILFLLFMAVILSACSTTSAEDSPKKPSTEKVKEEPKLGIEGLEIEYEEAFNHNHNGVTVTIYITNNTGYDVRISEVKKLNSNLSGFKLSHNNSYSLNGGILKNGDTKELVLLYFHDDVIAGQVDWVKPSFKVDMNGKTYHLTGEKMNTRTL